MDIQGHSRRICGAEAPKVGLCNEEMFKDTAEGKEEGEAAASRSSL